MEQHEFRSFTVEEHSHFVIARNKKSFVSSIIIITLFIALAASISWFMAWSWMNESSSLATSILCAVVFSVIAILVCVGLCLHVRFRVVFSHDGIIFSKIKGDKFIPWESIKDIEILYNTSPKPLYNTPHREFYDYICFSTRKYKKNAIMKKLRELKNYYRDSNGVEIIALDFLKENGEAEKFYGLIKKFFEDKEFFLNSGVGEEIAARKEAEESANKLREWEN